MHGDANTGELSREAQSQQAAIGGMHRWFHPLCGSHPAVLLMLLAQNGFPSLRGLPPTAIALASSLVRLPFTAAELACTAVAQRRAAPMMPPIFIIGHMRSGTTHLHNVLSRADGFTIVPPVAAGMPWEALGLVRLIRPLIEQYFPEHRFIDDVPIARDSPTEDEVALANMAPGSYYHALYFPRHFKRNYYQALFSDDRASNKNKQCRRAMIYYYARKMSMLNPDKPLLLKNPAYSMQVSMLRELWPKAKFIHIYRNPYVIFASTKHMFTTLVRELSLQTGGDVPLDDVVLDTYPRIMKRLLNDTAELPAGDVVHLRFENFEAQPLEEVARIFDALGLDDFAAARPLMKTYLKTIRSYETNRYRYTREDIDKVSRHWKSFITRWGYDAP